MSVHLNGVVITVVPSKTLNYSRESTATGNPTRTMERYGIIHIHDNVKPWKRFKIVRRRDNSWEIWKGRGDSGRDWYLHTTLRQHEWEVPKWSYKGGLIPRSIWNYVMQNCM